MSDLLSKKQLDQIDARNKTRFYVKRLAPADIAQARNEVDYLLRHAAALQAELTAAEARCAAMEAALEELISGVELEVPNMAANCSCDLCVAMRTARAALKGGAKEGT